MLFKEVGKNLNALRNLQLMNDDKFIPRNEWVVEQDENADASNQYQESRSSRGLSSIWESATLWRITTIITVIALVLLFAWSRGAIEHYRATDPQVNGYVEPRDYESIINRLEESVVTLYCEYSGDQVMQGTAFAVNLEGYTDQGKTALFSNHHVIENCIDGGRLTIQNLNGDVFDVVLENYDADNDLALLSADIEMTYLDLASYPPSPGYWVMSYGSADGVEGSISVGTVLNVTTDNDILVTAALSSGNSGGPLIDNEGNVFGVSTAVSTTELAQYNIVGSLDRMCAVILECDGKDYWDWG